jgi:energy-coupling factor transport system ATP-binding protein
VALSGVSYRYPDRTAPALDGVSLDFEPGEFVVLAGASGSGKSTFLRAVAGLVPHFHGGEFAGRARVGEMDTREHGPGELAADVASLFQDPETQVVMGTVRAELAFPLENRGWSPAAVARGVEEAALALGIDRLLDRATGELSGGELQRVALGATLAGRPSVVCLDEPTSQLDPVAGDELIGLLRRLNEDLELTVLLAEHRLERCLGVADRVIALHCGRVVFDGDPTAFLGWAVKEAPSLATPGARLLEGIGVRPFPGVKKARLAMRAAGLVPALDSGGETHPVGGKVPQSGVEVLKFDRVWHEIKNGPAILRGLSFTAKPGERIALMGRNGAGKSTFLRHAAGLLKPTRGRVHAQGRVALLLQNPTDYLVHDRVEHEASVPALERFHLQHLAKRHPRDLSGGEKQRLALAIVLGDADDPPATVCLDEPTRGMDRHVKDELADLLTTIEATVVVATHDPEFAALFADRVILLGDGRIIADGTPQEILSGGTYFATETARILDGAALTPAQGLELLLHRQEVPA